MLKKVKVFIDINKIKEINHSINDGINIVDNGIRSNVDNAILKIILDTIIVDCEELIKEIKIIN